MAKQSMLHSTTTPMTASTLTPGTVLYALTYALVRRYQSLGLTTQETTEAHLLCRLVVYSSMTTFESAGLF